MSLRISYNVTAEWLWGGLTLYEILFILFITIKATALDGAVVLAFLNSESYSRIIKAKFSTQGWFRENFNNFNLMSIYTGPIKFYNKKY
jgi:hypothetical protein